MGKIKLTLIVLVILCLTLVTWALIDSGISQAVGAEKNRLPKSMGYAGSVSCRQCHEKFYQLWSTSRHGLAMQPYTAEFAKQNLTPQAILQSSEERDRGASDINLMRCFKKSMKGDKAC